MGLRYVWIRDLGEEEFILLKEQEENGVAWTLRNVNMKDPAAKIIINDSGVHVEVNENYDNSIPREHINEKY